MYMEYRIKSTPIRVMGENPGCPDGIGAIYEIRS